MVQITTRHPVSTLKCDKCCRELGFDSLDIYSELVEAINQRHNQCDFCFCQGPVLDKHKSLQNGGLSAPLANLACSAFASPMQSQFLNEEI